LPDVDVEALTDLRTPWCIHVAVTLRIAEHVDAGVTRVEDLAQATDSDPFTLGCLLNTLIGKGIFEEPTPGSYALNEPARALMSPPMRLGCDLNGIGGRMAHVWGTMLEYVQTGKTAYASRFGTPFWDDLAAHPNVAASFDDLLGAVGHGTPSGEFEISGRWAAIKHVVDVGGGKGEMLVEILRLHPHVRGTLVEMPHAAHAALEVFEAAELGYRAEAIGRSFFEPLPNGADLYVMRKVLNNWPDAQALALLKNCAEAALPNGRIAILGSVCEDDARRDIEVDMMLVGGKPRTVSELRTLANAAGLEIVDARPQPNGYFVTELRPI